jgi:mono/diheme cytochrome c family protein/plastocyanin
MVGLVALATILVMYAADEPSRISHAEELQQEAAITRATSNYIQLCLQCHGPAGEGMMDGSGRVGLPIGGDTYATDMNQRAIDNNGEPMSGGMEARYDYLYDVIYNGRGSMPAWGASSGGQLNDEQVHEMVVFIQHADWNEVYNEIIHTLGGYPTVEPTAAPEETAAPQETETAGGGDSDLPNIALSAVDIAYDQTELTGEADTEFTITITNNGNADHDFVIDELGINSGLIPAGQSVTVTINAPAGDYTFYCSVPGHRPAGMEGTLKLG